MSNIIGDVEATFGDDVVLPTLSEDESFVLIKVGEDTGDVTLFNILPEEALAALISVLAAFGG